MPRDPEWDTLSKKEYCINRQHRVMSAPSQGVDSLCPYPRSLPPKLNAEPSVTPRGSQMRHVLPDSSLLDPDNPHRASLSLDISSEEYFLIPEILNLEAVICRSFHSTYLVIPSRTKGPGLC